MILTLPVAILISFICMYYLRISSNIMSLSGIAIAIGAMVDASIIMVENAHKKLEDWEKAGKARESRIDVIIHAAQEVGPSLFFSLLVITVGFLPVFTLKSRPAGCSSPLPLPRRSPCSSRASLPITFTPVLVTLLIKGKIRPEEKKIRSYNFLLKVYHPVAEFSLSLAEIRDQRRNYYCSYYIRIIYFAIVRS